MALHVIAECDLACCYVVAAGISVGFLVGMGLHEALDRYVWDDQTRPSFEPAWEKRATA